MARFGLNEGQGANSIVPSRKMCQYSCRIFPRTAGDGCIRTMGTHNVGKRGANRAF